MISEEKLDIILPDCSIGKVYFSLTFLGDFFLLSFLCRSLDMICLGVVFVFVYLAWCSLYFPYLWFGVLTLI